MICLKSSGKYEHYDDEDECRQYIGMYIYVKGYDNDYIALVVEENLTHVQQYVVNDKTKSQIYASGFNIYIKIYSFTLSEEIYLIESDEELAGFLI